MSNITFIVPVHTYDKKTKTLFSKAVKSVEDIDNLSDYKIEVVGPSDVLDKVKADYQDANYITYVENDNTDPFSQVNKGVFSCVTEYFSVFEFDDTYETNWYNNVLKAIKEHQGISAILPINETIDQSGNTVGFINEYAWSTSFSDDFGKIDIESLESYMDFNVTGALLKTEDFISAGCLKPSMKICSWYEFLLRLCYNQKEVRVMPKVCYKHMLGRKSSYGEVAYSSISSDEGKWLITTAKQEYFFKEDRKKTFGEEA